jgi:uncharacterized repeat protein (TIGR01451 family)
VISAKRVLLTLALIALPAACLPAVAGAAVPGPAWSISTDISSPTVFSPGDSSGNSIYSVVATNVGSKAISGKITLTDFLPEGLTLNPKPSGPTLLPGLQAEDEGQEDTYPCEPGPPARCVFDTSVYPRATVYPGEELRMFVPVNVAPDAPPVVTNRVTVSGGKNESGVAIAGASATTQTTISPVPAPFGVQSFTTASTGVDGAAETRAGSHPHQLHVRAQFNVSNFKGTPAENPRNILTDLPAGLVINPKATPVRCTEVQLEDISGGGVISKCPDASAVGVAKIVLNLPEYARPAITQPIYNVVPPQGRPAELAFNIAGLGIIIHVLGRVRSDGEVGLSSEVLDIPQLGNISGTTIDLWGDPSDPSHDHLRGECATVSGFQIAGGCPAAKNSSIAFLTMPTACSGPLSTNFSADSWQHPGDFISKTAQSTDSSGTPVGVTDCEKLSFSPKVEAKLSTDQAETGSAFDLNVDFPNDGLTSIGSLSESMTQKAVVTLPEGVTINPSVGEGLGFCKPAQFANEKTFSIDGEGCPSDSKVGTLHVDTPLLDKGIDGSVYLAQQDDPTTTQHGAENPFDTDIALYLVLRNAKLGALVKQALKVIPDPKTGQLVATLEDIPQLPFNHFNFHFKEGARAALISPAACGTYTVVSKLYPSSAPGSPKTIESDFEVTKGVNGGPCPSGGLPPFHPEFQAGSLNNNAKSYSPFDMRLLRKDGEQDMTKFSAVLPPGVLGKLAGVSKCPDSAVAAARTKTGRQEKASPSCPANSLIGHTFAGAGVGDSLTYVPGQLYLGGPYHGDPLSVISVTPALAGPFDAGTVVVREALTLNPETAEVIVDSKNSDPIPHILKGIVLKVRDLRVYVDRPDFIVNPTNCEPSTAKSTLFGSFRNVFDPSDDIPVDLSTRYQATSCLNLGFKPKLSINLNGGTKRGDHPALKAVVNARPGDANIGKAVVTLPQSAFLDQAHIRTICTRVQFAANGGAGGGCPKAAQYGYAKAITPLLDEPVEGPVYLRSSNHKLPDLVAALHGIVNVDIVGRIDSFKGGIRSSFETVPDAPVTKFVLTMQGGKKGLVVNSRNLCAETNRGIANFVGQNGVPHNFKPVVKPSCGKKRKGKGAKHGKK